VQSVGPAALGRAVIAHLGNGASMAAVRDGERIDTTMGMRRSQTSCAPSHGTLALNP